MSNWLVARTYIGFVLNARRRFKREIDELTESAKRVLPMKAYRAATELKSRIDGEVSEVKEIRDLRTKGNDCFDNQADELERHLLSEMEGILAGQIVDVADYHGRHLNKLNQARGLAELHTRHSVDEAFELLIEIRSDIAEIVDVFANPDDSNEAQRADYLNDVISADLAQKENEANEPVFVGAKKEFDKQVKRCTKEFKQLELNACDLEILQERADMIATNAEKSGNYTAARNELADMQEALDREKQRAENRQPVDNEGLRELLQSIEQQVEEFEANLSDFVDHKVIRCGDQAEVDELDEHSLSAIIQLAGAGLQTDGFADIQRGLLHSDSNTQRGARESGLRLIRANKFALTKFRPALHFRSNPFDTADIDQLIASLDVAEIKFLTSLNPKKST